MLKVLQKSVEDGELAWKSKISDAEQQKQAVRTSATGFVTFYCIQALVLKLYGSPTGLGSGEGPGGDNRKDKCRQTRYGSGACLHLASFFRLLSGF